MTRLEQLMPNAAIRGILPDALVSVVNIKWFGSAAVELTYKGQDGRVANQRVSLKWQADYRWPPLRPEAGRLPGRLPVLPVLKNRSALAVQKG